MKQNEKADRKSSTAEAPRRFATDILWIGLYQILNTLVFGLVTFPIITKSYSSEIYGVWTQINITVSLLSPLLALQLGLAAVRFLSGEEDRANRRRALGSMLTIILLIGGLGLIVSNVFSTQLSSLLFGSADYSLFIRLTFLWIFFMSTFNFLISYLRSRSKIKLLSIYMIILSLVTMGLLIVLGSRKIPMEWIVASLVAVQAIFLAIVFSGVALEVGFPKPNFSGLRGYLTYSVPQIPGAFLLWVISSSDRYFIVHFLGLDQAGIYSPSNTLGGLIAIFIMPLSYVLLPIVVRLWDQKRFPEAKSYMEYSAKFFLTLSIPSAIALSMLSQTLLLYLTTSEFLAGRELVFLIGMGAIVQGLYSINVNVVYLLKQTKYLPLMIISSSATSVILNITLIPHIGLLGAAISNVAAYTVLATIVTLWARRVVRYSVSIVYLLKVIVSSGIMGAGLYFFPTHNVLELILAIVVGAAAYLVCMILLKAFSSDDIRVVRGIIGGDSSRRLKEKGS